MIYLSDPGKDYPVNKLPKYPRIYWSPSKRLVTFPYSKTYGPTYFILKGVSIEEFARIIHFNGITRHVDLRGRFAVMKSYRGVCIKGFGGNEFIESIHDTTNTKNYTMYHVLSKSDLNLNILAYIVTLTEYNKLVYCYIPFGFSQYWYFAHDYIVDIATMRNQFKESLEKQFDKPKIKHSIMEIDTRYKYAIRGSDIYMYSNKKEKGFREVKSHKSIFYLMTEERDTPHGELRYRMKITPDKDMKITRIEQDKNMLNLYYINKSDINNRPKDKLEVINAEIAKFPKRSITLKTNRKDYSKDFAGRYKLLEDLYKTKKYNFKEMYARNMFYGNRHNNVKWEKKEAV